MQCRTLLPFSRGLILTLDLTILASTSSHIDGSNVSPFVFLVTGVTVWHCRVHRGVRRLRKPKGNTKRQSMDTRETRGHLCVRCVCACEGGNQELSLISEAPIAVRIATLDGYVIVMQFTRLRVIFTALRCSAVMFVLGLGLSCNTRRRRCMIWPTGSNQLGNPQCAMLLARVAAVFVQPFDCRDFQVLDVGKIVMQDRNCRPVDVVRYICATRADAQPNLGPVQADLVTDPPTTGAYPALRFDKTCRPFNSEFNH